MAPVVFGTYTPSKFVETAWALEPEPESLPPQATTATTATDRAPRNARWRSIMLDPQAIGGPSPGSAISRFRSENPAISHFSLQRSLGAGSSMVGSAGSVIRLVN